MSRRDKLAAAREHLRQIRQQTDAFYAKRKSSKVEAPLRQYTSRVARTTLKSLREPHGPLKRVPTPSWETPPPKIPVNGAKIDSAVNFLHESRSHAGDEKENTSTCTVTLLPRTFYSRSVDDAKSFSFL